MCFLNRHRKSSFMLIFFTETQTYTYLGIIKVNSKEKFKCRVKISTTPHEWTLKKETRFNSVWVSFDKLFIWKLK